MDCPMTNDIATAGPTDVEHDIRTLASVKLKTFDPGALLPIPGAAAKAWSGYKRRTGADDKVRQMERIFGVGSYFPRLNAGEMTVAPAAAKEFCKLTGVAVEDVFVHGSKVLAAREALAEMERQAAAREAERRAGTRRLEELNGAHAALQQAAMEKDAALQAALDAAEADVMRQLAEYRLPMAEVPDAFTIVEQVRRFGITPKIARPDDSCCRGNDQLEAMMGSLSLMQHIFRAARYDSSKAVPDLARFLRDHIENVLKPAGLTLLVGRYIARIDRRDGDGEFECETGLPQDHVGHEREMVLRLALEGEVDELKRSGLPWRRDGRRDPFAPVAPESVEASWIEENFDRAPGCEHEMNAAMSWAGGEILPKVDVVMEARRRRDAHQADVAREMRRILGEIGALQRALRGEG